MFDALPQMFGVQSNRFYALRITDAACDRIRTRFLLRFDIVQNIWEESD
jgi:hypothetical protein